MPNNGKQVLYMHNIFKSYGVLQVLKNVSLTLYAGEAMALMGENGAGKSTLVKVLAGLEKRDSGKIIYNDKEVVFSNAKESESVGIVVIHQELNLFDELSVLDNIFLNSEIMKADRLNIDFEAERKEALELFTKLKVNIDLDMSVKDLSIGQKQLIEIVKALRKDAKVLVMDEPTSALSDEEIDQIFKIINTLKRNGVAIVYISHRMQEIYTICESATILRDGELIGEFKLDNLTQNDMVKLMVGREINDPFPYLKANLGSEILRVENLVSDYVKDVSFTLNQGEVLGIGGLMGSGRTSLVHTLIGYVKANSGNIFLDNKKLNINHPSVAIKNKIIYISEDRKNDGLWLNFSIKQNISMPSLDKFINKFFTINDLQEKSSSDEFMSMTKVKALSNEVVVRTLSGGNQQKVAIARALLCDAKVLILDEPTRGIDIGARREIYNLINSFKDCGMAIILVSSDMQELIALSDRVMVMSDGNMRGILGFDEKSGENVIKLAVGI